ncbi:hypothetical protein F4819DRAFT_488495 [Hypoxylon fuscum]|nr:hypothetical protein F4819DRAFT_488495 [Hypoxylon fuscum]
MYAMNTFTAALLSTVGSFAAASPLDMSPVPRAALANQAVVNMYSGSTCGGTVQSFTLVGNGAYKCQAVSGAKDSIQVSENNCATYTWSGSNCGGSSQHISGNVCTTVPYAAVSVQC